MIHYSFSTVLMAVLTSNVIIVLIALCFQHKKILLSVGYKLLIVFLLLILVRSVFPFELPFAKNVILPEFISTFIGSFRHIFYKQHGLRISLWIIFEYVWIIGIIYKVCRYIYQFISTKRYIAMWSIDITDKEPYKTLLAEACKSRKNSFQVLKLTGIAVPCLYGILKPRILIPIEAELTEADLYYTFCHEISHHYHRDLLIKRLVGLLGILYWWNPACSKLWEQTDLLLEMRIDDSLVKGDPQVIKAYLQTLTHIADNAIAISTMPSGLLVSVTQKNSEVLIKRFEMMSHERDRSSVLVSIALSVVVFSLYLGSYFFTLENFYIVDSNVEGTFNTEETFYAVPREDGKYDLYLNGHLIEVLDSLEYYPDILIMTE